MGFVERQKSTIVLIKETGKFMNTGMTPVSKIHGGFVDCYESIIPNNLVEDIFVVQCRNNSIQFLPVQDYVFVESR